MCLVHFVEEQPSMAWLDPMQARIKGEVLVPMLLVLLLLKILWNVPVFPVWHYRYLSECVC